MEKQLLLGNESIARGAYEACVRVASAYPGTPSTEITKYISAYDEIYSEWAPNEKVSAEVAIGASIAGGRAMCAMKHVGLNVAADPIFTASYTGVNAGFVVCVADDMGMHSSQNEQDSRHYARSAKLPCLEPSDSADCKAFLKHGFDMSEEFDTPVLIRLSTRVSHSRGLVPIHDRTAPEDRPYKKDPAKYVMMPAFARPRHVFVEERMKKLRAWAETCEYNITEETDKLINGRKIGVISAGIAYRYAKEALGDSASYLKLGCIWPLPDEKIRRFAASVDVCYVIEELDPFIEDYVKALGISVKGKDTFPLCGEYTSNMIKERILGGKTEYTALPEPIPGRPPVMCAGCSHRGVFYMLKKLGLIVTGDIGCYTLGALPPLSAMDTCVCMGAGVGMAHGMEKVSPAFAKKTVAVIGDSTFIHSGITGLIDIVYNKGMATVIILDNITTGMTGHQDHPATGKTIKGDPAYRIDLEALCRAIGVSRVSVVDAFDLSAVKESISREVNEPEPSVIIMRRPCKLLGVTNEPPLRIDADKCISCGLCMGLGCPAISKTDGKYVIDAAQCDGCGMCAQLCAKDAIGKGGAN